MRRLDARSPTTAAASLLLAACGGGGDDGAAGGQPAPPPAAYTVGGVVSGLSGAGLVLRMNGGTEVVVARNGGYTFGAGLASGAAYSVVVAAQPSEPTQDCSVGHAQGVIGSANVTNVTIACATRAFRVGGSVAGLNGSGLQLRLNDATAQTVSAGGDFVFPGTVESGRPYAVTVSIQPQNPAQDCTVQQGAGVVRAADIDSVRVTCIDLAGTVGGVVTGLAGMGLELRNNGGDLLSIDANGSFRFATAIPPGGGFEVTVAMQPRMPRQTCVVSQATGSTGIDPVTSVRVDCALRAGNLRAMVAEPTYPPGSGERQTFLSLNEARGGGGFGRVAQHAALDAAALAHARYLATHAYADARFDPVAMSELQPTGDVAAHAEQPHLPSFTGVTPADRARTAGYAWTEGAEAAIFNVGDASRDCSDQILDSVVLRHRILSSAMRDIGIGIADTADGKGFVCVVLAAYAEVRGEAPGGWLGVYPFDAAQDVSLAMASDATGDAYGTNRGMPVMLMVDPDAAMALSVTLEDEATGAVIDTRTVTGTSPEGGLPANALFAVPSIYLEPGTRYALRIEGTVEGLPVTRAGGFTTGDRSGSAPFTNGLGAGGMRIVYAYPTDRAISEESRDAMQYALEHLQGWYQQQLGGETFSIHLARPEVCALPRDSAYYLSDSWYKIQDDIQSCAAVRFGDPDHDWIVYADVIHGCNMPGYLNAGADGLTMLSREAIEGLVGQDNGSNECAQPQPIYPMARWIGLLAHELGHTLGLPHPCDTYQAGCDIPSVMWQGSETYPAAHFAEADRQVLKAHRFIDLQRFGR
jgi:hypothetical protein